MVNTLKHPNAKTRNFQILELFISSTCALIPSIDSNICFILFYTVHHESRRRTKQKRQSKGIFFSTEKLSISGIAIIVVEATSTASDRVSTWS
jgi:hypothetical protein